MALSERTPESIALRERLRAEVLAAPQVVDLEVVIALRRLLHRGELSLTAAERALGRLQRLRIERHTHPPLLPRIWGLRTNVTPHDAAYVALAEALGVPLLTADARLANAPGIRCEVELLT
jgi:predicted nucleic acid-binding protein